MTLRVRKLYTVSEETLAEAGREVPAPAKIIVAAAVVVNPYAGKYVEDLVPLSRDGIQLGRRLAQAMVGQAGGPANVAAYSKAALVGAGGELEHASAIIHTVAFGDEIRKAANGEAPVPSTEKRGGLGSTIDISIKAKTNNNIRPFHQTFTLCLADAPLDHEIVVVVAGATGARPLSRLLDRRDETRLLA